MQLASFGVGLAGAAEEDLVFAARCCVVGSVVLEEEARGCDIGGVCRVSADDTMRKGCMADG